MLCCILFQIVCVCAMVYSLCAATMVWSGVMLHHAQVPHRACHGRLQLLPLALHHTTTTQPWQPNPVLDQLLFTFLLRMPVNSDPLGLTLDQSLTWCSPLISKVADNNDGHDTSTSQDNINETTVTGCSFEKNSSHIDQQGADIEKQNQGEKSEGPVPPQESMNTNTKVNNIQEALLIFYHALVAALWEVGEIVREANTDGCIDLDMDMYTSAETDDDVLLRKPKKSCRYHQNQKLKSSQTKMNTITSTLVYQSDIDESLPEGTVAATGDGDHDEAASDSRDWDLHGYYLAEDPDFA